MVVVVVEVIVVVLGLSNGSSFPIVVYLTFQTRTNSIIKPAHGLNNDTDG